MNVKQSFILNSVQVFVIENVIKICRNGLHKINYISCQECIPDRTIKEIDMNCSVCLGHVRSYRGPSLHVGGIVRDTYIYRHV